MSLLHPSPRSPLPDWQWFSENTHYLQASKSVYIKNGFTLVLLQHYWLLREAVGNKTYYYFLKIMCILERKNLLCIAIQRSISVSRIFSTILSNPAKRILDMSFTDWWAQRAETWAQNFIAEDIFICSQITRETLCQTTSFCRETLWQYWQLKNLLWFFQWHLPVRVEKYLQWHCNSCRCPA